VLHANTLFQCNVPPVIAFNGGSLGFVCFELMDSVPAMSNIVGANARDAMHWWYSSQASNSRRINNISKTCSMACSLSLSEGACMQLCIAMASRLFVCSIARSLSLALSLSLSLSLLSVILLEY
jgi:hypothetical protein